MALIQFFLEAIGTMLTGRPDWLEQKPLWVRLAWAILLPLALLALVLTTVIFVGRMIQGAAN